ncbi:hypothetical protein E2C01_061444 [Portunus trituberculatus]|uniref:Uncharacterized protein n=1 Tax=Portunus trituberculatus TaxID=210409 RepID=A0A5B7H3V9_PORTR|nr:hypothetical protein [Portunus trituberculatus]
MSSAAMCVRGGSRQAVRVLPASPCLPMPHFATFCASVYCLALPLLSPLCFHVAPRLTLRLSSLVAAAATTTTTTTTIIILHTPHPLPFFLVFLFLFSPSSSFSSSSSTLILHLRKYVYDI